MSTAMMAITTNNIDEREAVSWTFHAAPLTLKIDRKKTKNREKRHPYAIHIRQF